MGYKISNMKKFIGTKVIMAEPMTMTEAQKVLGREIKPATDEEDGYLVEYDNGYKSWSPKSVFDKYYRISDTFVDRLKIELSDLSDKVQKLEGFQTTDIFKLLPIEKQSLLSTQLDFMKAYSEILNKRIKLEE